MSAGAVLLDSAGRRLLRNGGRQHLSDGAGDACCCAPYEPCVVTCIPFGNGEPWVATCDGPGRFCFFANDETGGYSDNSGTWAVDLYVNDVLVASFNVPAAADCYCLTIDFEEGDEIRIEATGTVIYGGSPGSAQYHVSPDGSYEFNGTAYPPEINPGRTCPTVAEALVANLGADCPWPTI